MERVLEGGVGGESRGWIPRERWIGMDGKVRRGGDVGQGRANERKRGRQVAEFPRAARVRDQQRSQARATVAALSASAMFKLT